MKYLLIVLLLSFSSCITAPSAPVEACASACHSGFPAKAMKSFDGKTCTCE